MKYVPAAGVLALSTVALAGGKPEHDDLSGPDPEVVPDPAKVDLPALPAFELPATEPGFHTPRELRVHGKPVLGTEIKVKGYVTWIYDCVADQAAANPKATRAQIQLAISSDPTLCSTPKFYLGDARTTPRDASVWVVDVPRPPSKQERERMSKEELKALPAIPKLTLGDYVVVTGTWAIDSPHAEHNTDGLLVYSAHDRAAPAAAAASATSTAAQPAAPEPDVAVVTKAPLRKPVADQTRNSSIERFNACNKGYAARQFDAAIAECQAATKVWDGNHRAWYALASAHMAKGEWPQARDAIEHAVKLRPDQSMYQLYYGIALYESERRHVREDQARKERKKPEEVSINPALLKLDAARDALLRAAKLVPDLWRAHLYLGRIYRDRDDARHAAEHFAATIKSHPSYRHGYIALSELYRRWDYNDQALEVAVLGTANVPAAEASEVWFEVGVAYDVKHAEDKAIEAFGKAIASKPNDVSSKFQRGQIYFRKGDLVNARADLEAVVASGDPAIANAKPFARQILAQIAGKQH